MGGLAILMYAMVLFLPPHVTYERVKVLACTTQHYQAQITTTNTPNWVDPTLTNPTCYHTQGRLHIQQQGCTRPAHHVCQTRQEQVE